MQVSIPILRSLNMKFFVTEVLWYCILLLDSRDREEGTLPAPLPLNTNTKTLTLPYLIARTPLLHHI